MTEPTTNEPILALRGLRKRRGAFDLAIDLVVPRGYVVGLVGANGSGKTTTIGAAIGTVVPDEGVLTVPTMDRVGVVLDSPFFMPDWTPDIVERAVRPFYPAWSAETYAALLRRFEIGRETKVKELSRGLGMKLQWAVALSHGAELLVLDEATAGLDPVARDDVLDLVAEFMEDERHGVLFSSHITSDLDRLADYVVVLDHGRVLEQRALPDLLAGYRLVRGGPDDLTPERRAALLGLRVHATGFEGLAPTTLADGWVGDLVLEQPTLDEIVVALAKGVRDRVLS